MAEKLDQLERQSLEDISQRLDRIERAIILLLSGNRGSQSKQLIGEIEAEQSRQRILYKKYQSLWLIQEQLSNYGINKPIELLNEESALREEIERLNEGD